MIETWRSEYDEQLAGRAPESQKDMLIDRAIWSYSFSIVSLFLPLKSSMHMKWASHLEQSI
jgi:hypothetical protein